MNFDPALVNWGVVGALVVVGLICVGLLLNTWFSGLKVTVAPPPKKPARRAPAKRRPKATRG